MASKTTAKTPRVTISGTLLSGLLHELAIKDDNAEALLFGSAQSTETRNNTDENEEHITKNTNIVIHEYRVLLDVFTFYDSMGNVDENILMGLLGPLSKNLVGWVRFRRNTWPSPALRECAVTENLHKYGAADVGCLLALVTSARRDDATQDFDYAFLWIPSPSAVPQRLLLDTGNLIQSTQTEYDFVSAMTPTTYGSSYSEILSSSLQKNRIGSAIKDLEQTRDAMLEIMKEKLSELAKSEARLRILQDEVRQMDPTNKKSGKTSRRLLSDSDLLDLSSQS